MKGIFVSLFLLSYSILSCNHSGIQWILDGGFIEDEAPKLLSITPNNSTVCF